MTENIYQAPDAELGEAVSYEQKPLATTGQRFINMLIDTVGYILFSLLVGVVLGLTGFVEVLDNIPDFLFGFILMSLYFLPQEALWGRTLGKLVTQTRVVNKHGKDATFSQIVGRTLIRFVPFEAFSFLGGAGHPCGWHDSWSKTKVISLKKPKTEKQQ